ncbi:MAG: hypothetical protein A2513_02385 [Sulfurimonas sp. RIFOXYD12_FULL_33_39]|uniref:response regulator transcription factor n=1 Tax=unclassified Sulfurimonas TaxID=2623549 RepID=UPI0008D8B67F|nr:MULTISPECIES: winged helix-turn-helix domain-containing protein [unclassified Sulfurimonas]OHE07378.1 MAG: hypothetical protein A3G74_07135 [Sulfurimonas sp. RIFCSPLOWO2_12_FULL_34_6]OHE08853.1 MAG: hypothetical protein A2513_02385 [Sulfurimonas sp. RIFOXYD12_FULL_33_39]OHE14163.1 MAG: hypothetical protein A2530_05685 [Sulfurimonas sp. RIFOXYD2_FULL_34_21]
MDKLTRLNLLFLEDNEDFALHTAEFLNIYFRKVFICTSVKNALCTFGDNRIDVIISDIRLEEKDGLDFIKEVREIDKECVIAILSAYKDEEFLFRAIPLNLISYELKPIRYDDFILLLKKISSKFSPKEVTAIAENLKYDSSKKELLLKDTTVQLTKKESLFIELLIKNTNSVVSHERVQRDIWESRVMSDAAIKNMIFRLRKKVGIDFISTVQGVGYKLSNQLSF